MPIFDRFFAKAERPEPKTFGAYSVRVVSLPEELDDEARLPIELRFLFRHDPALKEKVRSLLASGKAIGVRTIERTPERLLEAIQRVSVLSQHNCVLTWLPELLREKHRPTISDADRAAAKAQAADLDADLREILDARLSFKRLVLVDEDNVGIGAEERRLMSELSETLYPLSIDHIVHRLLIDNANERTEIAQNILKALLIIGPIAHLLEKWVSGFGKVFAASTDDLLGETAELMALRGSGFSWKTLSKRFIILVPIFGLAAYGAFHAEAWLERGWTLAAGALFGLSAVALSLTTAVQSVGLYRTSVLALKQEGKWHDHAKRSVFMEAIRQDFTNPAHLGLLIGSLLAPFTGMLAAVLGGLHNGWILALVGSTESIAAGLTVIFSNRLSDWKLKRMLERRIEGFH
jgi:hypothetical protein